MQTIGPVANVDVPPDARVIYGRGRWLVPGLIDMHVHVRAVDLLRYVENGVTTVRDLAGLDSVLAVKVSSAFGPRIFVASKLLTGPNAQNPPFSLAVTRAQDAAAIVDAQLARGCDSIKVYDDLARDVYDAIGNAAHERGVRVAGHVTHRVDVGHAMAMQDSIEHLSAYPLGDANRNRELANASRDAGVWNCPTMVVYTQWVTRNMAPEPRQRLAARRARGAARRRPHAIRNAFRRHPLRRGVPGRFIERHHRSRLERRSRARRRQPAREHRDAAPPLGCDAQRPLDFIRAPPRRAALTGTAGRPLPGILPGSVQNVSRCLPWRRPGRQTRPAVPAN